MSEHFKELLSPFIDNEVTEDEAEHIRHHLAYCEECQEELNELMAIKEELFDTYSSVEIPESIEASVMERIHSLELQKAHPANQLAKWMTGLVVAVLLIGMSVLVAPMFYILAKLVSALGTVGVKVLQTIPIIVGAIPYFSVTLYGVAAILIIISGWFLYRLLVSGSFDRRELL